MSGIGGFYDSKKDLQVEQGRYLELLEGIKQACKRRGPDGAGVCLLSHAGLVQTVLTTKEKNWDCFPATQKVGDHTLALCFDGEIYNRKELFSELGEQKPDSHLISDAQLLLAVYMKFGPDCAKKINGAFAFAVFDSIHNRLILCRDRFGIKPLFFSYQNENLVFASEPKGIFACPDRKPILDLNSLNQVFSLGPARTPGCGVYQGMEEVKPAHFLVANSEGIRQECYWTLESKPHEDSYEETVAKTRDLIKDAVLRQMEGNVATCTFLSGGIDSSLVSAICAEELKKKGERLTTYSFDFTDNDKNFKANAFQPSLDRPYVDQMVSYLGSDHHYLECDHVSQADCLMDSVKAHDLPAMGDIDSSMLYFCSLVKTHSRVALTGECADEIFGGYPWFHKQEAMEAHTFPWTMDLEARKILLKQDFIEGLQMEDYVKQAYEASVAQTPRLLGETGEEKRRREIAWLNLQWFMQTLLNRMDRDSGYCGLGARVPFADYRLIAYLWNVPWEMKARDGVVKGLLRQASVGLLPDQVLMRRKSPYPKTYDTRYEALLVSRMQQLMEDGSAPVMEFLDKKKLLDFLKSPSDYGKPWYGQLMAGPQMMAYMLQMNEWMKGCTIQR